MSEVNEYDNTAKKISSFIKKNNNSLILALGEVSGLKQIGQGGNGLVYSGIQNKQEVAIKFLVEDKQASKLQRFKAEYFNINLLEERKNIVNYLNFEEIQFNDGSSIPVIIMKKYEKSLKAYRNETQPITEKTFKKLFKFLLETLSKIHNSGIIHRDIKPENILVTKDVEFILTDFGIASYNPELYTLKAITERKERLANYEFSAPEQVYKGITSSPSMDIYALGQVCQWFVFGETHRGTNRSRITDIFNSEEIEIIDIVLNKCLDNNPVQRYQTVNDIYDHMEQMKKSKKKIDPFDEMYLLNDAIRATCPLASQNLQYVQDEKYIKRLVDNINKQNFKQELWFNTGIGNNYITKMKYLGNNRILMNHREIKVIGLWLYEGSHYDDLIIIETEQDEPYIINGQETYYAMKLNDEYFVEAHHLNSGYIEIADEVYNISDLKVEEYDRTFSYKYYFIGTKYHCSIIEENDKYLSQFQKNEVQSKKLVAQLIDKIRMNKHEEVYYRL